MPTVIRPRRAADRRPPRLQGANAAPGRLPWRWIRPTAPGALPSTLLAAPLFRLLLMLVEGRLKVLRVNVVPIGKRMTA
jgi:hypothetical protein